MTAIRIIDNHAELSNIGTKTHAQIDTHIDNAGIHIEAESGTAQGQMAFWDATAEKWCKTETSELFWDDTNKRFGLGTASPTAMLSLEAGDLYEIDTTGTNNLDITTKATDGGKISLSTRRNAGTGLTIDTANRVALGHTNPRLVFDIKISDHAGLLFETTGVDKDAFIRMVTKTLGDANGWWQIDVDESNSQLFEIKHAPTGSSTTHLVIKTDGNIGIGTTSPTAKVDINSDILRLRTAKTPASAGAAGNQGDICWDADYVYVCTATNTWKRAELLTW